MNKILRAIGFQPSGVKLRVIKNISKDLRDPRQVHRLARRRECAKVAPAIQLSNEP